MFERAMGLIPDVLHRAQRNWGRWSDGVTVVASPLLGGLAFCDDGKDNWGANRGDEPLRGGYGLVR